jgi:hypothetical protein
VERKGPRKYALWVSGAWAAKKVVPRIAAGGDSKVLSSTPRAFFAFGIWRLKMAERRGNVDVCPSWLQETSLTQRVGMALITHHMRHRMINQPSNSRLMKQSILLQRKPGRWDLVWNADLCTEARHYSVLRNAPGPHESVVSGANPRDYSTAASVWCREGRRSSASGTSLRDKYRRTPRRRRRKVSLRNLRHSCQPVTLPSGVSGSLATIVDSSAAFPVS